MSAVRQNTMGLTTPSRGWESVMRSGEMVASLPTLFDLNNGDYFGSTEGLHEYIELKLCTLPLLVNFSHEDVFNACRQYGLVTKIEIHDSRVQITFSPPPMRSFWTQPLVLYKNGAIVQILRFQEPQGRLPRQLRGLVDPTASFPEKITQVATSIVVGSRIAEDQMLVSREHNSTSLFRPWLVLDLKMEELIFIFTMNQPQSLVSEGSPYTDGTSNAPFIYRARVKLNNVSEVRQTISPNGIFELVFPLSIVPRFEVARRLEDVNPSNSKAQVEWERQTEWPYAQGWQPLCWEDKKSEQLTHACEPLSLDSSRAHVNFGQWSIFRVIMDSRVTNLTNYWSFTKTLQSRGIPTPICPSMRCAKGKESREVIWQVLAPSDGVDNLLGCEPHLAFEVWYQLSVCVSHGIIPSAQIERDFLHSLAGMGLEKAVALLEQVAESKTPFYNPSDIFALSYRRRRRHEQQTQYVMSRSVTITPTRLYVNTPAVEIANRVLRKWRAYADHFLRVRFIDENENERIYPRPGRSNDQLYNRILNVMNGGISIAGRHYEFLAWGNSQMRENGAYFLSSTARSSGINVDMVRRSMGDFSAIQSVAKYASRMGLCFTTTVNVSGWTPEVQYIEDETNGPYTFTDGVGKISSVLATTAALGTNQHGLRDYFAMQNSPPSVFQFRLGGCKGVVVIDPTVKGNTLQLRHSQKKFDSDSKGLEICKSSAFTACMLNRQIIAVLSTLGIPDEIFLGLLDNVLSQLVEAKTNPTVAARSLRLYVDVLGKTTELADMIDAGLMAVNEPFVMSCLFLWISWTRKRLREKMQISIKDGAFLFGCTDESKQLRGHSASQDDLNFHMEDRDKRIAEAPEVFVQICDNDTNECHVLQCVCIVVRNPALHPGDVRVCNAVDIPALHHIKNAVVFPQVGDRDLPSMCSGGDLDGDEYMVIWEPSLIPKLVNWPAMDFTPPTRPTHEGPINSAALIDFFVQYMRNEAIGTIANAHLAHADRNLEGVSSPECLALANLHSIAVDYPKSGVPANIDGELRVTKFPHFMGKPAHKSYLSKRVLGRLHDRLPQADFPSTAFEKAPFDRRIVQFELPYSQVAAAEELVEPGKLLKAGYDEAIRSVMVKHGIKTEFEVVTGFVKEHNGSVRDYTITEELGRLVQALSKEYRTKCLALLAAPHDPEALLTLVVVLYRITAVEAAVTKPAVTPMISFPWLFRRELVLLAKGQSLS